MSVKAPQALGASPAVPELDLLKPLGDDLPQLLVVGPTASGVS
ncbi:hypothetical protein [Streptomyces sp. V1I6]|nr:hypothetical protein [Streptomyces sp. V1I6]